MDKKKTRSIGLKKAMFGDVNPEGGMPSAENLLQLGNTLKGTASFNTEEDSAQDFYSEENGSTPEESVLTEPGLKQVKLNLMEWDNETLKKVFGGTTKTEDVTVEGKTYSVEKFVAPKDMVTVEMAVRVISLYNVCIDISPCPGQGPFRMEPDTHRYRPDRNHGKGNGADRSERRSV